VLVSNKVSLSFVISLMSYIFLHLRSTFRCTHPSSLSPLLPHLDARDNTQEYADDDDAFDPDDMY
jgi:hypothetical protein